MTCREFVDFLISYIDENLAEAPETYRDTIRLGKFACRDEAGAPPEDAPEELIQAILAARNVA
jgi:hypothetical protein